MTRQPLSQHNITTMGKSGMAWFFLFGVIAILPALLMFGKSLLAGGSLSLAHYSEVFAQGRVYSLLFRSVLMAAGATVLSVMFGVTFAVTLSRCDFYGKKICAALYLVPLFIPPHIHALVWMSLWGEKGVINTWLMGLFHLSAPVFSINSLAGAIIVLFFSYFPLVVLLTRTGLSGVDRQIEEAAGLQKTQFTVLGRITLPLISPYIVSGAVFVFIFAFFNYGVPSMLRIPSYPGEIFSRFSAFYDEAGAAALSAPLVIIAFLLLYVQNRFLKNKRYAGNNTGNASFSAPSVLPKSKLAAGFVYGLVFLSVVLPVAALIMQAGSLASYTMAMKTSFAELQTTVIIAAISATCTCILALFLSHSLDRLSQNKKSGWEMMTFLPFAFPAIFFGIGMIHLWNTQVTSFVYGSLAILVIGCIARFIPFAVQIIRSRSRHIDSSLGEAACFCPTGIVQRWFKIDLPLMQKGILTCWIITFFFCTGELGVTLLVIPPGYGTVSLKIYNLLHYGAGPLVAAMALILIGTNLVVSGILLLPDPLRHSQP